ncbi:MAG: isoprenylcysteine carboxylmethyltransferase family protein [Acidobacteria bacterium]|nr:isoprenylcysteine carboxylmethyltransferase family protein [Acidobacteriota bacterium]
MNSQQHHDAAAVKVFPPAIPLATILAGVALQRALPIAVGSFVPEPARYWIGGLIVAFAVLFLGLWSVVLVRKSGQSENPWKPTTQIVQHGPFRITRNPMYLQMVVGCIGFAVLLANPWILLLTPLCAWLLQRWAILPEEAYLERKFGSAYASYKRRVRRWL